MSETLSKEEFYKKRNDAIFKGLSTGKVYTYPKELIDYLRPYHYGGMPISIMMLVTELCDRRCYDRAIMISLAFDDATLVHGDIESLRLGGSIEKNGEGYAEHAFIETKEFGGDKTWVVDTSVGLIFDKDFYYELEKVSVNSVYSKEQIMQTHLVRDILSDDFESQKFVLTFVFPQIEKLLQASRRIGTRVYAGTIASELEKCKKAIGYDDMLAEIESDLEIFSTDPNKLDEKFGIVTDRYGREISRNGKPNPYYISPEEADELFMLQKQAKTNHEAVKKIEDIWQKRDLKVQKFRAEEDARLEKLAKERLAEILQNRTTNFYEEYQK